MPDLPSRDCTAVTAKYATSSLSYHPYLNSVFFSFQSLAPIYEQLADAFLHAKDKVVIAKVDADGEGRPVGQKYGVTGYPSE
jgi:thiol-disulfide isomerase/thioredoxin